MKRIQTTILALPAAALLAAQSAPAMAAKEEPVVLITCTQSYGTIAVVDGDTQGWTKYGLGSPRELINALATESGCFTPHNAASGRPADFLMNVVAGDKEEVDQSIETAKAAAMEGLVRSGAANSMLSNVPMASAVLGMFGGLGGKKKTVAAGIKLLSPANGMTIALGSGEVTKSSLTFGSGAGGWVQGAASSGYAGNKDGKMLVEAFVKAFNAISAQGPGLAAMVPVAAAAPAPAMALAEVAVDTRLRSAPLAAAAEVRALRAGTTLTPTGKREGLFVEVKDNFGTAGWVSVEDLK
jgi:hypothetical protein